MRYFKLIVCTGILLLLSAAAFAQQDYINVFAGGGPNDVMATIAPVYQPTNITFDSNGNVYFSSNYSNYQHRVWKITKSTGILTIVAGGYYYGYSGDGGLATNAQLYNPLGIAVDHAGNVFIADESNQIIREVNAGSGIITTIAGTPQSAQSGAAGDGGPATSAHLYNPTGVALDKNGNLFIADQSNGRIRIVSCATVTSTGGACTPNSGQTAGDIYTVAGSVTNGNTYYNGDGIAATTANLYNPYAVATDNAGNLYIADTDDQLVRQVACGTGISSCTAPSGETSGDIYTLAGTGESVGHPGTAGYNGDGIVATTAEMYYPAAVAVDNSGNLFIGDEYNQRIREVSCAAKTSSGGTCTASTSETTGDIYTVAGTASAGYNGDGKLATIANLYYPIGVAVDPAGDLVIADYDDYRIREVYCDVSTLTCTPPTGDTAGDIYTIAGTGSTTFFGNNIPATGAEFYYPYGAASDSAGNIYIADRYNCVIRQVNGGTGIISTFAGTGTCSYSGDGGAATSADLNYPARTTVDSAGNVFIADTNNCLVRKVSGGTITTIAGKSPSLACGYMGDGAPATSAELYYPYGLALDPSGNLYIADSQNQVIRMVACATVTSTGGACTPKSGQTTGDIYTFAGNHTAGFSGDGGPATSAELYTPYDVAADSAGNVYIADYNNLRVRKVNTSGIITTYAGNGSGGYQGDGGPANETAVYYPWGVAVDLAGDVLIAEYSGQRIRLVDQAGNIHTVAGTGTAGVTGNGGLATSAELYAPVGVGVDPSGNIYEAEYSSWLVRKINALTILGSVPASVSFGTQTIKTTSDPVALILSANGNAAIASIVASAGFTEVDDCPTTLNSSSSCQVDVSFSPTVDGVINGTLTVTYPGYFGSLVVPLQGTATGLTLSPTSLGFGNQSVQTSVTKNVTVKGTTTYAATLATLTGDTTDFTIASNTCTGTVTTSCIIGIKFDPTTTGAKKATLLVHDNDPTSPQLLGITGTGSSYESFSPASITFKEQVINTTSANTKVTFKYAGTGTITLNTLVPSPSANFAVNETGLTGACNPGTTVLSSGQTCLFNVTFNPGSTFGVIMGTVTANFTADPNGITSAVLPLTGTGTEVKITGSLAFGTVVPPATKTNTLTITNEGTTTLTFSPAPAITGSGATAYSILGTSTCPSASLTHLQTCTILVKFTPPAGSGQSFNATLDIYDTGGGSPQTVAITGKN